MGLIAKFQNCPFVDACGHKDMEAIGFLTPSTAEQMPQQPVAGYRRIESYWDHPKILITPELCDELVQEIARGAQLPEWALGAESHEDLASL